MKRPKKQKKDKYELMVDAELDLHGYFVEQAKREVRKFLSEAYRDNFSRVRIIVGRGNHSEGRGAVLRDAIKALLNHEGYEYTQAKIQDGGEGALEVKV